MDLETLKMNAALSFETSGTSERLLESSTLLHLRGKSRMHCALHTEKVKPTHH
jgi:hypothetical protein